MSQSRRHSVIEALVNVFSGMIIALAVSQLAHVYEHWIQVNIWNEFKWSLNLSSNILMTAVLTAISVIRGYIWRRVFNKIGRHS